MADMSHVRDVIFHRGSQGDAIILDSADGRWLGSRMPPSIDPVDNMFGTGTSLLGRVLTAFASGWIGNAVSRVCGSFTSWYDLTHPVEVFSSVFDDFGVEEVLGFVFWPLIVIYYLLKIPFYVLFLVPVVATCLIRILFTDDPILFWALVVVAVLAPGLAMSDGNLWSLVPLVLAYTGIGAGLWWALHAEHPEWLDEWEEWRERRAERRAERRES